MNDRRMNRRCFMTGGALAAGALAARSEAQTKAGSKAKSQAQPKSAAPAKAPSTRSILNYNQNMEYRRLGKTGLMVSAVSLGGHWKRIEAELGRDKVPKQYDVYSRDQYSMISGFMESRDRVIAHCIDCGFNYLDAMEAVEVAIYAQLIKKRRDKIYFGYAWQPKEPRVAQYRNAARLLQGLDENLKSTALDYIDLWRITLPMEGVPDLSELQRAEEATVEALAKAKQQGKIRFGGVSSHNRAWLKSMVDGYPKQIEVVLFPYTAGSKALPTDSLFDSLKENDTGAFGIKPFADNSLFAGDSFADNAHAADDDRRARMAIRYILSNPALTAPIPGLINIHQVDNVVQAIRERRELDLKKKAQAEPASRDMWARLRPSHEWLKQWEYV